jgi:hypothetical protein
MGQCTMLSVESPEASSGNSVRSKGGAFLKSSNNHNNRIDHLHESGRKENLKFNVIIDKPDQSSDSKGSEPEHLTVAECSEPDPIELDTLREGAPAAFPLPPQHAVRTRCYKLNMDSELVGLSGSQTQSHNIFLGPFLESYSSSDDSSQDTNGITVATIIQTAQIFRGIAVSSDRTILSQNTRARQSNRGNTTQRGEMSQQAAKISKAKDLVEESVLTGKKDSDEPANMMSLFIVGEYDDMKQLVHDGSRKLRKAEGIPD